jgi:hypothetical protein
MVRRMVGMLLAAAVVLGLGTTATESLPTGGSDVGRVMADSAWGATIEP